MRRWVPSNPPPPPAPQIGKEMAVEVMPTLLESMETARAAGDVDQEHTCAEQVRRDGGVVTSHH